MIILRDGFIHVYHGFIMDLSRINNNLDLLLNINIVAG